MKHILLFGAGKSATCLVDFLIQQTTEGNFYLTVADNNPDLVKAKVGQAPNATGLSINVENENERRDLIRKADIVLSLLPPALHILVAETCVELGKNLLTASYVDEKIKALEPYIKSKGLLFLCEMGLDPGIDHMSAMKLIHQIKEKGGIIHTFKSHTGGLVAPQSDDNPWHYKISWNPRNVVMAGSAGAIYRENNQTIVKTYSTLFEHLEEVEIPGIGKLAFYPNRDSLSYIPVYALETAETFIRTTLRYPEYCLAWKAIVASGLTNDKQPLDKRLSTIREWAKPVEAFLNDANTQALHYLGLFEESPIPLSASTSADILQFLLETRLAMKPSDKDMIVMLHEIGYQLGERSHWIQSSLIVMGENSQRTAMAKTVGLPMGIAAMLILNGKIKISGLHIPIVPEIYEPVLELLETENIRFTETFS